MRKIYLLILITLFTCCSRKDFTPQSYMNEITDAVKFHVAEDLHNDSLLEREKYYLPEDDAPYYSENGETYFTKLKQTATNKTIDSSVRKDASDILRHYERINIKLSGFTPIDSTEKSKTWKFTEGKTGREFEFKLSKQDSDDDNIWECSEIESENDDFLEDM